MKKITLLFISLSLFVFLTSCDKDVFSLSDETHVDIYNEDVRVPISEFISKDTTLSEYVKLLKYTDLYNALNLSTVGVKYTAFVPNNDAMKAFYKKMGIHNVGDLDVKYARSLVLYHLLNDSIQTKDFLLASKLENISGTILHISFDTSLAGQPVINNEAHVIQMGLCACNGKIYTLDAVLNPLIETIGEKISNDDEYSILHQAVKETGWIKDLCTFADTVKKNGVLSLTRRFYTMLMVDDATYKKAGITDYNSLLQHLRSRSKDIEDTDSALIHDYISYHIFKSQYNSTQLSTLTGSDTIKLWTTSAPNQILAVSRDSEGMTVFNKADVSARFVDRYVDIEATNGLMHKIDSWLPIYEPEQAVVVWDLADFAEVKSLVESKKGKEYYQPVEPTSSEEKVDCSSCKCYSQITSKSDTKNKSYHYVDYATCPKTFAGAMYNDRVVFNVGYLGTFEMTTPTLVKGKYKVEIRIVYTTKQNFIRSMTDGNGGLMKINFDDNLQTNHMASPYTQITSFLPGVYTTTLCEEIEFSKTSSHKMKFTVMDPAASTNANFCLQFDAIVFTPLY